ncbi:MAG: hypothetical protein ACHQEM_12810 [Chitinophagales bacterium]
MSLLKEATKMSGEQYTSQVGAVRKVGLMSELDGLDSRLTVLKEVFLDIRARLEPVMDVQKPKIDGENEKDFPYAPLVERIREQMKFVNELIGIAEDVKDRIQI